MIKFEPIKFVQKGWGYELWIVNDQEHNYCGKLLFFNKGKRCSYHLHRLKSECFCLGSGKMVLRYSWEEDDPEKADATLLLPGMKFEIPVGLRHQMIALEESSLYEFSTFHRDSDSIRIVKGD